MSLIFVEALIITHNEEAQLTPTNGLDMNIKTHTYTVTDIGQSKY